MRDILKNFSCRPYYIQDKFGDLPNCSNKDDLNRINKYLKMKNQFSDFKAFHKRPCTNFGGMTYQLNFKVLSLIY